jgi:hypothetical protein
MLSSPHGHEGRPLVFSSSPCGRNPPATRWTHFDGRQDDAMAGARSTPKEIHRSGGAAGNRLETKILGKVEHFEARGNI